MRIVAILPAMLAAGDSPSPAPGRPDEQVQACREREMRNRIAIGELNATLGTEWKEWLEKERPDGVHGQPGSRPCLRRRLQRLRQGLRGAEQDVPPRPAAPPAT